MTGAVQPEAERSAKFSVVASSVRSSQLRISPRLEVVICGDRLLPDEGDDNGWGDRGVVRQSVRPHPIAAITANTVTIHVACFCIAMDRTQKRQPWL
jgi:hypothetical protein